MNAFLLFLAESSAKAGLLAILVLAANRFLLRRSPARWRHLLWGLVALRLTVPAVLPDDMGLFRIPSGWIGAKPAMPAPAVVMPATGTTSAKLASEIALQKPSAAAAAPADTAHTGGNPTLLALFSAWLCGALGMLALLALNSLRHAAFSRRATPLTRPDVLGLLESCRREMGVRTPVGLVECPAGRGPALSGILRPKIILPCGMAQEISRDELRHIFLHELAHLRRHDVPVNCACALLLAAHWFNPLVHLAFARMRREQELACDEAVLEVLGASSGRDYGHTLINLGGYISTPVPMIGAVGLGTDKRQLKERITMINRWKNDGAKRLPGLLTLILGCTAALLTEACTHEPAKTSAKEFYLTDSPDNDDGSEVDAKGNEMPAPTENQPGYSFFQKFSLPGEKVVVISQASVEAASIGSYTANFYDAANTEDTKGSLDDFVNGIVRPRDGSIAKAWLADVDGDGKPDVVVRTRCAGTGNFKTLDAFGVTDGQLRFLGSTGSLNPEDKGGRASIALANATETGS